MDNLELCTRLLASWCFREQSKILSNQESCFDGSSDYGRHSFIAQIIRKKMEVFRIPIKIPDELIALIELCTESNPGMSQLMLADIIGVNRNLNSTLTSVDFVKVYANEFPIVTDNPKWMTHFEKMWDAQKTSNDNNLVDTPEWWLSRFTS